jgi:hypothetical protein
LDIRFEGGLEAVPIKPARTKHTRPLKEKLKQRKARQVATREELSLLVNEE